MSNDNELRQLLAYLGAAEIASGVPAHEAERDVRAVGRLQGAEKVQVQANPGGLVVSLGDGTPATFETVEGGLRLDQAALAGALIDDLLAGRLSRTEALGRLRALRAREHPSPVLGMYLGGISVGLGLTFILQPDVTTLVFAVLMAPVVVTLMRLTARGILPSVLLPLSATFVTGCVAFWAAQQGWLTGPLRSILPVVAVLLPGATLVTGIAEVVSGAMTAGVARLGYGATQLLMFSVGLLAAANLLNVSADQLGNVRASEFGPWSLALGLVLVALGIALMEAVPARFVPWVLLALALTLVAQVGLQTWLSVPAGGFAGALVASLTAYLLSRFGPRVPRLVVFLPSFWLLVPGSLGLLSVSSSARSGSAVADVAVLMLAIALGMVIGAGVPRVLRAAFVGARREER